MPRRSLSIITAAAVLVAPAVAVAKSGGDDDRGRDDRSSRSSSRDQRVGAGTVTSYAGGVLVLTLADGSTLQGRVTRRTEIECSRRSSSTRGFAAKHGSDDDRGESATPSPSPSPSPSPRPSGSPSPSPSPSSTPRPSSTPSPSPAPGKASARCGRSLLVAGAPVRKARLRGATFKKVHLFRS
jgi:hypothetical protein